MDRKIGIGIAFGVALGVAAPALAQEAVQWRIQDGGNGHWYHAHTLFPVILTWEAARSVAEGNGGSLATITTAQESSFVLGLVKNRPELFVNNTWGGPWLGAYQPNPNGPANLGWVWVTGEPWIFTNWSGGEPNDAGWQGGRESYLQIYGSGQWNDFTNDGNRIYSLIIEWSADCNGDGIVDYGQILDGTYDDLNSNGVPDCCDQGIECDCPADINQSGTIDAEDLAYVLFAWGMTGGKAGDADINGDAVVDASDLSLVLGSWGICPQ